MLRGALSHQSAFAPTPLALQLRQETEQVLRLIMRSWIRTALWLGAVLPAGAALAATEDKIELQGTPRPLERPGVMPESW